MPLLNLWSLVGLNLLAVALSCGAFGPAEAHAEFPVEFPSEVDRAHYLRTPTVAEVTQVDVTADQVHIRGVTPDFAERWLVEWPLSLGIERAFSGSAESFPTREPLSPATDGSFEVTLPRFVVDPQGAKRDRAIARWGIALVNGEQWSPASRARGVDSIEPRGLPDRPKLRGRKGLGAYGPDRPQQDLEELGIAAVTVNVLLDTFIRTAAGEGRVAFEFQGRTWFADSAALEQLDRTLLAAARHDLLVSAIILVRQRSQCADPEWGALATHPDADPAGIFVMPNVTDEAGIAAYGAALQLLAERYSRVDAAHGRIHHWILHNEVDSGWVWTNAGSKTAAEFTELLHRSLRLADTIVRQHDPAAKVFVSLDHHWTTRHDANCHGSREILDHLLEWCAAEGDFDWAIAHHPYAQDLGDPRTWRDDQIRFDFDTPKITYRNLEVLDAWVRQPRALFRGERLRTVHLTEQGLNSRSYSESDLLDQAAGMAYAWNKVARLDSIEMFHYHNWVDNRHEGGLRIGLRRFPDDADDPLGVKPIWQVFRALDTDQQEQATDFAMERIGIEDWSQIMTEVELPAETVR